MIGRWVKQKLVMGGVFENSVFTHNASIYGPIRVGLDEAMVDLSKLSDG